MPGLAPLAAIGPVVQLGPHSVELHGRTLRDECAIEAQICFLRGDVVKLAYEVLSSVPEEAKQQAALEIVRLIRFGYSGATNADASRWLSSFEGRLFSVWLSIRHAGLGLQATTELICQEIDKQGMSWLENVEFGIDIANGTASFQAFAEIRRIHGMKVKETLQTTFQSYDDVWASLQKEPFNKSSDEVLGMTMHQIGLLVKEKDGELDERESDLVNQQQVKDGIERPEQYEAMWGTPYKVLARRLLGQQESETENGRKNHSETQHYSSGKWRESDIPGSWVNDATRCDFAAADNSSAIFSNGR